MAFFLGCVLFLLGVFLPSVGFSFWVTLIVAALIGAFLFFTNKTPQSATREEPKAVCVTDSCMVLARLRGAMLALFVIVGTAHYNLDNYHYVQGVLDLASQTEFRSIIITDPERRLNTQTFYVSAIASSEGTREGFAGLEQEGQKRGKILVRTSLYPRYFYGDELFISGRVTSPPENRYGKYLAKERVHATMSYPRIERIAENKGSPFMAAIFRFKHGILETYRELLTYDQAALISGVTISANADFSREFLDKLSWSGTRHLTAVSGQNMSIVIAIVWGSLAYFLPKSWVFFLTFFVIGGFAAMTGFEISAVRAAIMGFIAWSAKEIIGRPHAIHNALVFAGAILVALNPKILVFDVGFHLSFLATAAIIYLTPVLKTVLSKDKLSDGAQAPLGWSEEGGRTGFLNWRESFWVTISAQLAVAPVLILNFQNFSLTSLVANVMILPIIPFVMTLGFLLGIAGLIFSPIASALVFVIYPLLEYIRILINIFAELAIGFNPQFGATGVFIYYAVLVFVCYRFYNKKNT